MKTFKNYLLFLLCPAILLAGEPGKFTKQKTISKAYNVNSDAVTDIKNAYGNIYVTTWDEDKVDIDVLVKVSGDNEEWVSKRLAEIDVEFEALKALISARTLIPNGKGGGKNNSIEINYTVKIPKKGGVKLNNKYGNILTTDLFSSVNVNCQYGRLTMAKLTGGGSQINLDYSNGSVIEFIKTGNVDADYSKLTLNDFGTINLDADYTDVTALSGDNIKYTCNYGKLNFGKIGTINGDGDYMSVKADKLSGSLRINANYSKIAVSELTSGAGDVSINSKYTNIALGTASGYGFDYDVHVRYGNFDFDGPSKLTHTTDGSSKSYVGSSKKGSGNKITIRAEYGNVKFTDN